MLSLLAVFLQSPDTPSVVLTDTSSKNKIMFWETITITHLSSFPSYSPSQILEVLKIDVNKWKCVYLQQVYVVFSSSKPTRNVCSSSALLIKHVHHVALQSRSLLNNYFEVPL